MKRITNNYFKTVYKHREEELEADGFEHVQKVSEIIKLYELNEDKIIESIGYIGTSKNIIPAFKYIAEPFEIRILFEFNSCLEIRKRICTDQITKPIISVCQFLTRPEIQEILKFTRRKYSLAY